MAFGLWGASRLVDNEVLKEGSIPTVTPIDKILNGGNCGEVTNHGEEAREFAVKLALKLLQPELTVAATIIQPILGASCFGTPCFPREATLERACSSNWNRTVFQSNCADPHVRWSGEGGQQWPPLPGFGKRIAC